MIIRQILRVVALVAIGFGSIDVASAQTARAYQADDLGTLGGLYLVGSAINNSGEVVGYGSIADGTMHAFRWSPSDGLHDIAPGGHRSAASGINDNGDIVGVWIDEVENQVHAFVLPRGGAPRDLDPRMWRVDAILNDGRMTGIMFDPDGPAQVHAFRTNPDGSVQDIDPGNAYASDGRALNDLGEVTGFTAHDVNDQSTQSAFRFSDGAGKEDLGTLGGPRSVGGSINNAGVVVGWSEVADPAISSRAFRARPGFPMEDLGSLMEGQLSGAAAINQAGAIVGWSESPSGGTAFLFTDADGMIDLRALIPSSVHPIGSLNARAINDAGQIVILDDGADRANTYRLTPVVDLVPPMATATASPASLWPPNDRMIPVSVEVAAADAVDPAPLCRITSVRNSQAPSHGIDRDVRITGAFTVSLRASIEGPQQGRIYTINVRCTDFSGNATDARTVVVVRRDRDTP